MGPFMRIRTIVIDDEKLSRQRIADFLESESDIEIIQSCASGEDAIKAVQKLRPDLIFLDIHLPDISGFEMLKATETAEGNHRPLVIFTTAHDQYALRAFEAHAFDYLLKPFTRERFQAALDRVREEIHDTRKGSRIATLLQSVSSQEKYMQRLVFRSKGRIVFLNVTEIQWIESEGNYLRVHSGKESYLIRETLAGIEAKLDPEMFIRIHRSTIVNLTYIKEMKPWFEEGESVVFLQDGTRLTLSRTYLSRIGGLLTHR